MLPERCDLRGRVPLPSGLLDQLADNIEIADRLALIIPCHPLPELDRPQIEKLKHETSALIICQLRLRLHLERQFFLLLHELIIIYCLKLFRESLPLRSRSLLLFDLNEPFPRSFQLRLGILDSQLRDGNIELIILQQLVHLAALENLSNRSVVERNLELLAKARETLHGQVAQVLGEAVEVFVLRGKELVGVPCEYLEQVAVVHERNALLALNADGLLCRGVEKRTHFVPGDLLNLGRTLGRTLGRDLGGFFRLGGCQDDTSLVLEEPPKVFLKHGR